MPVGHPQFGQAQRCRCQLENDKLRTSERSQRASNLTDKLLDKRFETFKPTAANRAAFARCQQFAKQPSGWLYVYGNPGTGKTHLLAAVANVLLHTSAHPLYVVVPDWLAFLRDAMDEGEGERSSDRMHQAMTIPVLLLDDLGAEKRTPWTDEQLYRLLNHRYDANLPTVVCGNLPPERLEDRIGSRLQDVDISEAIGLGGPDYRRRQLHLVTAEGQAES